MNSVGGWSSSWRLLTLMAAFSWQLSGRAWPKGWSRQSRAGRTWQAQLQAAPRQLPPRPHPLLLPPLLLPPLLLEAALLVARSASAA
jgi:hypothetical protein